MNAPLGVVAADRHAGVAALRRGDRALRQHLGERAEAVSIMRNPVRPRAAEAAGSTPFAMVPGGAMTSIGR